MVTLEEIGENTYVEINTVNAVTEICLRGYLHHAVFYAIVRHLREIFVQKITFGSGIRGMIGFIAYIHTERADKPCPFAVLFEYFFDYRGSGGLALCAGDAEIVVCGGAENMSAAPYALPAMRFGQKMDVTMGTKGVVDTMVKDGLWDAFNNYHMGSTAENICDIWGITREDLDDFGYASQVKWNAAQAPGKFADEIVAVPVKVKKEIVDFKVDEFPRPSTNEEGLAKLKAAFPASSDNAFKADGGTVEDTFGAKKNDPSKCTVGEPRITAGNASGVNDGAAAIVLASGEAVKKYGLKPMAKLLSWGQGGVDPKIMGTGPIPASRQAMEKAGLTIEDFDLIEANEAFAAQSLAVAKELHFDMSKVNVNGGALAIGHPVGCSGARIIVTLLHEMQKRDDAKKGLATLCIGGGMGVATVFEKC